MAWLTGTDADVAADLTLPPTTVESEDHEIQDPGMAGPGTATLCALTPPPVHHPRAAR